MAIASLLRDLFAERTNARVLADDHERLAAYQRAWQAYYGNYPDSLPVSPRAGLPAEDNVKLNYARLIVDKGVYALFGQPPTFDLDSRPGQRSPAEQWLDACLAANHWPSLLLKLATNGAVCGHAYVKIMPMALTPWAPSPTSLVGEGEAYRRSSSVGQPSSPSPMYPMGEGAGGVRAFPRLIVLSPEYVTVATDPDDIETPLRYTIEWTSPGGDAARGAAPMHHRQIIARDGLAGASGLAGRRRGAEAQHWQIIDEQAEGSGPWKTLSVVTWPHPWPPIHDCQNLAQPNLYYGLPDLTPDLLELIEALNYVASNIVRITRHHAHPKTWGRGFRAQDMKLAVNEIMVLPSENAELRNLEMAGNLAFSHKTLDTLREILHELAAVPEVTSGKLENIGPLSGVALGILYSPLIDRSTTKRATYGPMLESLAAHLLELSPYARVGPGVHGADRGADTWPGPGFGGVRATLTWPDSGPTNQLEKRQILLLEEQLGVSQDTILTKLGYDPAIEQGKAGASSPWVGSPNADISTLKRTRLE